MINLFPHQQQLVDSNPPMWGLWFTTGIGKTITSIALAEKNYPETARMLVIVPKTNREMWQRETNKWRTNCTYTIITKEEFRRDAMILDRFDGIIGDEFHYFAGEKSQLSKTLRKYMKKHNIKFLWACTATPFLSSPMSVYTIANHLGRGLDYWSFRRKFFYEVRMGFRTIMKPRPNMDKELAEVLRSCGTFVDMGEAVRLAQENPNDQLPTLADVPEQTFETEYFELTDEQKEAITTLDEAHFITKWTKTHAIEQGILYSDGYTEDQVFPCHKTDRIIELCMAHDKVAIFCKYTKQITYLQDQLVQAGITTPIYILNGDTNHRDRLITEADNAERAIIIIQAQVSAGYELPSFPLIIFASLSFSYIDYAQAIGRFLRINHLKANRYVHLVANGLDRDVYGCIMAKKDFSYEIYANQRTTYNLDR